MASWAPDCSQEPILKYWEIHLGKKQFKLFSFKNPICYLFLQQCSLLLDSDLRSFFQPSVSFLSFTSSLAFREHCISPFCWAHVFSVLLLHKSSAVHSATQRADCLIVTRRWAKCFIYWFDLIISITPAGWYYFIPLLPRGKNRGSVRVSNRPIVTHLANAEPGC